MKDDYIFSSAGKKRKEELVMELFNHSPALVAHGLSCYLTNGTDCLICDKFLTLVNVLVKFENQMNKGKLDIKKMVENGIVESCILN